MLLGERAWAEVLLMRMLRYRMSVHLTETWMGGPSNEYSFDTITNKTLFLKLGHIY